MRLLLLVVVLYRDVNKRASSDWCAVCSGRQILCREVPIVTGGVWCLCVVCAASAACKVSDCAAAARLFRRWCVASVVSVLQALLAMCLIAERQFSARYFPLRC